MKIILYIIACCSLFVSTVIAREPVDVEKVMLIAPIEEQARKGNPDAQYALGWMFLDGYVVPKDKKSMEYLEKAFLANPKKYAAAGGMLGTLLLCQGNDKKGWKYIKDAAEAGDSLSLAQCHLLYNNVKYLKLAAEAGHAPSMSLLSSCYRTGSEGLQKNEIEAFRWLRRSREFASPDDSMSDKDLISLAEMYYKGLDGEKDIQLAQALLEMAYNKNKTASNAYNLVVYFNEQGNVAEELLWYARTIALWDLMENKELRKSIISETLEDILNRSQRK